MKLICKIFLVYNLLMSGYKYIFKENILEANHHLIFVGIFLLLIIREEVNK